MSIESVMPCSHLILCCPLLLPSIFAIIRVFSNKLALCIKWPEYWSLNFSISPSNEYAGLISFRIDWFDFAVQRTLRSLLQHHSLKVSVLQCSTFFRVQLLHPHMTTGKTMKVKVLVAQSYLILCDPLDCSLPNCFVHGILQARKLEWVRQGY